MIVNRSSFIACLVVAWATCAWASPDSPATQFLETESCTRILSVGPGAGQHQAVVTSLSHDKPGAANGTLVIRRFDLLSNTADLTVRMPMDALGPVKQVVAMGPDAFAIIQGGRNLQTQLVKIDSQGRTTATAAMPGEMYVAGGLRATAGRLVLFGSSQGQPALHILDANLKPLKRVLISLPQVQGIASVIQAALLPGGDLMMVIQREDYTVHLARTDADGQVKATADTGLNNATLGVGERHEIAVGTYAGADASAHVVVFSDELRELRRTSLFKAKVSALRVNVVSVSGKWLAAGSQVFAPAVFVEQGQQGFHRVPWKQDDSAVPSTGIWLAAFGGNLMLAQERKPIESGKPMKIGECGGYRVDFRRIP